jgi:quercetin dioxygenase-like cupin family protein
MTLSFTTLAGLTGAQGDSAMMTRREMNATLGALATLFSGTIASLRAEASPQQSAQATAQPNAPRGITTLMTQDVGELGDSQATMLILTLPPKFGPTPPHKHTGPVFAYMLEGHVENQVDPEEPKTYSAGDSWYEPAMHVHRSLRNLSETETAKILVVEVFPKGKPAGLPAQ